MSGDTLTLADIRAAVATLDQQAAPTMADGMYHVSMSAQAVYAIRADTIDQLLRPAHHFASSLAYDHHVDAALAVGRDVFPLGPITEADRYEAGLRAYRRWQKVGKRRKQARKTTRGF